MQLDQGLAHGETGRSDTFIDGDAGRIVLLGLGNILLSDEGVGVHAINTIKDRYSFFPQIDIIDGGTMGLDLLPLFQARDRILIIDAVDFGKAAGTIGMLRDDAIPSVLNPKLSVHHIGVADLLFTARLTRTIPPSVCLIGIQPKSLEVGLAMTDEIRSQIESIIELAIKILAEWSIRCTGRSLAHTSS
jgi:hydrogenase maturation protease